MGLGHLWLDSKIVPAIYAIKIFFYHPHRRVFSLREKVPCRTTFSNTTKRKLQCMEAIPFVGRNDENDPSLIFQRRVTLRLIFFWPRREN